MIWQNSTIGVEYQVGDTWTDEFNLKQSIGLQIRFNGFSFYNYPTALGLEAHRGITSFSKPLEFLKPQAVTSMIQTDTKHNEFTKVTSIPELDSILSKNKGKKIILDFYADWCTSCKELEEVTFSDSNVKTKMDEFILIQADVTLNDANNKKLTKKYGVFGPPAILFFNENGELLQAKTIIGFIEPDEFLNRLNQL